MKVATVGSGVTAGVGSVDAPSWPQYLFNWLTDQYGSHVSFHLSVVSAGPFHGASWQGLHHIMVLAGTISQR